MNNIGVPELFVLFLVAGGFVVLPTWKIFSKAGYPGILSLLILVPLLNVVVWCFLGFSEWPVLKELRVLRQGTLRPLS